MVRGVEGVVDTQSWQAGATSNPRSTVPIPARGDLIGINIELTVKAVGSAGTVRAGRKITNAIERFAIRDRNDKIVMGVTGRQLERIANQLAPRGEDVDAVAPGGTSIKRYVRRLPIQIRREDQGAYLDVTEAPVTEMYSAAPATRTEVSLKLRGKYRRRPRGSESQISTVRTRAFTIKGIVGENELGAYLAQGEIVDKLLLLPNDAGVNPLSDSDVNSVRLIQDGYNYLTGATMQGNFIPEDVADREGGHNNGEINLRVPVFTVRNTTEFILDLNTAADFNVITVSRQLTQPRG